MHFYFCSFHHSWESTVLKYRMNLCKSLSHSPSLWPGRSSQIIVKEHWMNKSMWSTTFHIFIMLFLPSLIETMWVCQALQNTWNDHHQNAIAELLDNTANEIRSCSRNRSANRIWRWRWKQGYSSCSWYKASISGQTCCVHKIGRAYYASKRSNIRHSYHFPERFYTGKRNSWETEHEQITTTLLGRQDLGRLLNSHSICTRMDIQHMVW